MASSPHESDGRPILFVGDSITEQWSRFRPRFFRRHGFVNRGVGGQTTRQIRERFADEIVLAKPGGIHLLAGLNDIAENEGPVPLSTTQANLAWMIDRAVEAGCPVLVGSVTPADVLAWNPRIRPADTIIELNKWLRDATAVRGAAYVDYHAVLRTPEGALRPGLGPDGSHLNARGYRLIEAVLLEAIGTHLKRADRVAPPAPLSFSRWLRLLARGAGVR